MRQTIKRLNNLTNQVERVLNDYPITRDSDIELFGKVCELFYPPFERPIYSYREFASVLRSLPSLDHLARARRKVVQNNGYKKYLPNSKAVAEARGYNRDVWHAYARQHNIPTTPQELTAKLQQETMHLRNVPEGYDDEGNTSNRREDNPSAARAYDRLH